MNLEEYKKQYTQLLVNRSKLMSEAFDQLKSKEYIEFISHVNEVDMKDKEAILHNIKVNAILEGWLKNAPLCYQFKDYSPKK